MAFSSQLPGHLLDRLPRLQLDRAWHAEMSWKFGEARDALTRVERALEQLRASPAPPDDLARLEAKLDHRKMMLALLADDLPAAYTRAKAWLEKNVTSDPFMCASAGSAVLCAGRELYHCEGIGAQSQVLQRRYLEGGALYGIVFHECSAGGAFAARGDLRLALESYERGIEMAIKLQGENSLLYNVPALVAAELHYERNDLRCAAQLVQSRLAVSELGFVDNLMGGFLTRIRLKVLQGESEQASELYEDGVWFAKHYGFDRMQAALLNERLRHLLAQSQIRQAMQAVSEARFTSRDMEDPEPVARDGCSTLHEYRILGSARLWIATGAQKKAAHALRPWYAFARAKHCDRSAIRIGALLIKAYLHLRDEGSARRILIECLQMGHRGPFIRTFVDEGPIVADLIADLHERRDGGEAFPLDYTLTILQAINGQERSSHGELSAGAPNASAPVARPEPLSGRDLQILKLSARGLQNADVAASLGIAPSTVKWYWQRIFDKFDVRRRSDAIRIARRQQIIP